MKNLIFTIFLAFVFCGCASKTSLDEGIIKSSNPIFLQTPIIAKNVYVKFGNTSNLDSNLTQAVKMDLAKNGFSIIDNENFADLIIKGNLNYFRRNEKHSDDGVRFGFGFGFGSHHDSSWGVGSSVGIGDDDFDDTSYIYDAQVSLLLRVKENKKFKDYSTNLEYQSNKNLNSKTEMNDILNYKVCKQIRNYLGIYSKEIK